MRLLLTALALPLAACSGSGDDLDGDSSPFDFRPPTAQALKDYTSSLGRRFNRVDRDHDGALDVTDFPRHPERLARWDSNKDGRVTREEYEAAELARFAAADRDKDQILTTAERSAAGWGRSPTAAPAPTPTPSGKPVE
ncbi:EF-hand domain-containing protein [Sphingomonas sp. PB4P5]|uniref:EF-hand domain-containing protein n=1 Tax=Parasphingomonas puruogangriensis TaxID=3096155 RepID=UPI002FC6A0C2